MLAIAIIALWIGSAVAGWNSYWPWLIVPFGAYCLYIAWFMSRMRAARKRVGFPTSPRVPGTSMAPANAQLILLGMLQHAAIFGAAAGIHWVLG